MNKVIRFINATGLARAHLLPLFSVYLCGVLLTSQANAAASSFETWSHTARIAGAAVWADMTSAEINTLVSNMNAQNVSVIEADSNLSNYLTETEFEQELTGMSALATAAHASGIKVVWYYPSLEVLTPNGDTSAHTMYKDHPDWVQIGLNGSPNVFYGGLVFWVEPGMESAWLSPSNPGYRQYFIDRARAIAATGVDGLWLDVPLLNNLGVDWADTSPSSTIKFLTDTSLTAPVTVNWNDITWRRWVDWRHHEITDFLTAIRDACNSVNPNFKIFVETVTMDYNDATKIALDGSALKNQTGLTQAWELDAISDTNAMRRAKEDDWISMIAMNKFARAASGSNPSWIFTYGSQANDAELVMAESIATGNNPYETKIPEMATTVGAAYRTKMFGWIKANEGYLYGTSKGARVAILYSPSSRDYVDQAKGTGLYVTTQSAATEWWSTDVIDSAYSMQYLAEYRGMVKLLVHNHIPFNVVVHPDAAELAAYDTVLLPDVEALSDEDATLLAAYTNAGGHLIVTGPNPTGWDKFGSVRAEFALAQVLGISKANSPLPVAKVQAYGAGEARFFSELLGKKYFTNATDAAMAGATLLEAVNATSPPRLSTNANKKVHMELTQTDSKLILQYVNFIGVTGTFAVTPTTASTTLKIPVGKDVTAVELTSPDNATPALAPLAYTKTTEDVTFSVPVTEYALVLVSLTDTAPPPAPTLSIAASAAVKAEGSSGTTPFTFNVTRSGDLTQPSSAEYTVAGSGANPADAADFSGALTGTVSFAANETSQFITVNVVGDTVVEPSEGFTVSLLNPTNATISNGTTDGTIQNDDAALDTDADGVADSQDNCTLVANTNQRNTDGDSYGNACDPDFNGNSIVDPADFSLIKSLIGSITSPDQDLNGNGIVDPSDFSLTKSYVGKAPGPSGLVQ